jgi:hypothetical protein
MQTCACAAPFEILKAQPVQGPDGADWTVSIARGNQWKGWKWTENVDALAENDGSSGVGLVLQVLLLPSGLAAMYCFVTYHLVRRRDWRVTIRKGVHTADRARRDAVYDERCETKQAAAERAQVVLAHIRHGTFDAFPAS